jgi:hypothetical protein
MDGVTVVSKIWGGKANIAEYRADGPAGHIELVGLRICSPVSHQWSLNFATPSVGTLGVPRVGEFINGRGEFNDQETINGRAALVRFSIWGVSADTAPVGAGVFRGWRQELGSELGWVNRYARVR